jgi:hypothetical protein
LESGTIFTQKTLGTWSILTALLVNPNDKYFVPHPPSYLLTNDAVYLSSSSSSFIKHLQFAHISEKCKLPYLIWTISAYTKSVWFICFSFWSFFFNQRCVRNMCT